MSSFAVAILCTVSLAEPALAKVGDCPAITVGELELRSHDNYLEAIKLSSDAVQWRTVVSPRERVPGVDPAIETDAQLRTTCLKSIKQGVAMVTYGEAMFQVEVRTGKIIGSTRGQLAQPKP